MHFVSRIHEIEFFDPSDTSKEVTWKQYVSGVAPRRLWELSDSTRRDFYGDVVAQILKNLQRDASQKAVITVVVIGEGTLIPAIIAQAPQSQKSLKIISVQVRSYTALKVR